jgi:hypothetical protein
MDGGTIEPVKTWRFAAYYALSAKIHVPPETRRSSRIAATEPNAALAESSAAKTANWSKGRARMAIGLHGAPTFSVKSW